MSVNLDLTFMPWGGLAAGLLTGKYNDDPEAGGRRTDHGWGGLEEHRLAVAREVVAVAQEIGATPSQVALSWVRQRAATVVPIIGARKPGQLKDNLGSVNVTLTRAQQNRLDRVSAIERGFPYDFITGGRDSFMGPVTHLVDDHRHTVV